MLARCVCARMCLLEHLQYLLCVSFSTSWVRFSFVFHSNPATFTSRNHSHNNQLQWQDQLQERDQGGRSSCYACVVGEKAGMFVRVCARIVPLHDAARALAGRCPLHAQAPTCPDTALHTHEYPRSLSRAKTDTARWIPSDHMRRLMAWLLQHPTVVTALPPRKGAPS